MHKLLVYDDDSRRLGVIRLRECPTAQQRDARSAEIVGAYENIERAEPLVGRQLGLTLDLQSHTAGSAGLQVGRDRDCFDTRHLLEARNHLLDEERLL